MKFQNLLGLVLFFASAASANDQARVIEVVKEVRTVELSVKNFEFGGDTKFYQNQQQSNPSITVIDPQVVVGGRPRSFIASGSTLDNFCKFLRDNGFPELAGYRSDANSFSPRAQLRDIDGVTLNSGGVNIVQASTPNIISSITCQ